MVLFFVLQRKCATRRAAFPTAHVAVHCRTISIKESGMSERPEVELTAEELRTMAGAFRRSRVLLSAVELDVFSRIAGGHEDAASIAAAVGADARATDRLLNALCAIGLLCKADGRFRNSAAASRHLVRGGDAFLGNLDHMNNLWDTWSTLTPAIRRGGCVAVPDVPERDDAWLEAFIAAMHARGAVQAPHDINLLDLHDVTRVLDVGGGSGAFAMAFAAVKRDIGVTVFDLPSVIPITERYIARAGMQDRIRTRAGNYNHDSLGGPFDLVYLSAIVHSNGPEANLRLIAACAAALAPGGSVVVQDFIMDEDRTGPADHTLFSLNMLVGTPAGDTYTEAEVRTWLEAAGLRNVTRQDTRFGAAQVIGRA
jgi:SAM-dependent methyltransferase